MKILFIVSGFPDERNQSRGIFNFRACRQLSQFHDVTVIQLRLIVPGRRLETIRYYQGIRIRVLSVLPFFMKKMKPLALCIASMKYFLGRIGGQYDIVHSVGLGIPALFGSIISNKRNIPHIVQVIGSDVNEELPEYSPVLKRFLSRSISAIGANSEQLLETINKYLGIGIQKVIYRGVNITGISFHPDKKRKRNIVYLGGFISSPIMKEKLNFKGGMDVCKVWQQNEEELNTLGYSLLIGGPSSGLPSIESWKRSLRFPDNVVLAGVLPHNEVKAILAEAEFVLLPSHNEGLPNVAMEAMASGAIVLASKVGGVPELIRDEYSGFLFEAHDLEQIGALLKKAVGMNDKEKQQIRVNARAVVERQFDSDKFASGYTALYRLLAEAM